MSREITGPTYHYVPGDKTNEQLYVEPQGGNVTAYNKLWVALAGLATAFGVVFADGAIDGDEYGVLATAVAVAVGVFLAKNEPVV